MSEAKPLILVIEDEEEISSLVAEELENAGMNVQVFHKVANVLPFLKGNFVNLMLLDVGLPDGTGFDALRQARDAGFQTPAIFLTANTTERDRVTGLDIGADDYVAKPFSFPELIARIKAVLRRTETAQDQKVTQNAQITEEPFTFCGATVNPSRLEMDFPDGATEKIGKKELGITHYLANHTGNVITRRALIHAVWGIHADVKSRSLDQYVVKIRNLLSQHNCSDAAFKTIHGVGYLYEPDKGP